MRIGQKIFLVGGIPIAIAAAIAVAAVFLQNEAERARSGALVAGTIYRNVLTAVTERDRYVDALPGERDRHVARFAVPTKRAETDLENLRPLARDPADFEAIDQARQALTGYVASMVKLTEVTARNDSLIMDMGARADRLIELTDEARQRQQEANSEIVSAMSERDSHVRAARDLVEAAYAVRSALTVASIQTIIALTTENESERVQSRRQLVAALPRLRDAVTVLYAILLGQDMEEEARQLEAMAREYDRRVRVIARPAARRAQTLSASGETPRFDQELTGWAEQLLKVHTVKYRALHDGMADLLARSVAAHETEQATQNVAVAVLKLGEEAASALKGRSPAASLAVLENSGSLSEMIAGLPISPLIRTQMSDAFEQWREGLATTAEGLRQQNELIGDMDEAAYRMIQAARALDARFTGSAESIGRSIRTVLILGAAIGLVLGSIAAAVVASSISAPLKRLQEGMLDLAGDPHRGRIEGDWGRDELGDMAQATNVFVGEILRREQALRRAKDRADEALAELRRTQSELVQAEKLASLGQLVTGVAHEINTPLGIALTTSTVLDEEVKSFREAASSGRLARQDFERFTERMEEGTRLMFANLSRAADLVQSFKQVTADQASGERRSFNMKRWLEELLTSLGPMLRKSNHEVTVECPETLVVETFPGSLAQVLTNLLTNSIVHGYEPEERGRIRIRVETLDDEMMRLEFSDDGRGIPQQNLAKVFDPFFTTGRSRGSTGLGLHIVYNIVTSRLQGRLNLESRPGEGARFTIDIPISAEAGEENAEVEEDAAPRREAMA